MTAVDSRLTDALRDRYLIERELGQGGMATVYLAQDLKHDRKVAIKVLRPELGASLGPERFLQEIRVILLVAVALGVRRLAGPPRDVGSTNVLAVLPFTVRGSPTLEYLGEGLVTLLSASLDGAAGIRSVNPHALLGFVGAGRSTISLERARGVAEHFQAGLFVVGDVLEVQGKVRLSASLFDRTQGDRPLAEATVDGESGDVLALVDLLATRLVAARSAEGGTRLTQTAAVTTSSLPALKAYLAGEQAYRAGQYASAVSAFQEAAAARHRVRAGLLPPERSPGASRSGR